MIRGPAVMLHDGLGQVIGSLHVLPVLRELLMDSPPPRAGFLKAVNRWLLAAVGQCKHQETAALGFYFAKLWYYERLYPQTFVVAALGRAVRQLSADVPPQTDPTV